MSNTAAERRPVHLRAARSDRRKREAAEEKVARAQALAARLAGMYPKLECPLIHANTFELLVAVILSAQCTDAAVNRVTPELFRRYPTPAALSLGRIAEIESLIHTLGLFRAKARSLKSCAEQLLSQFNGEVPSTMAQLTTLGGVGRKTANVILGHAFNTPGVVVDTHCKRLARRLGLTRHEDPVKIEHDLRRLLPPPEWTGFSHRLIIHGRQVCNARKPACQRCELSPLCPSRALTKG